MQVRSRCVEKEQKENSEYMRRLNLNEPPIGFYLSRVQKQILI